MRTEKAFIKVGAIINLVFYSILIFSGLIGITVLSIFGAPIFIILLYIIFPSFIILPGFILTIVGIVKIKGDGIFKKGTHIVNCIAGIFTFNMFILIGVIMGLTSDELQTS